MSVETTWTIKRLLDWTSEFFQSKELESARLSAEVLLAEALGCQRIELYTRFDEVPMENVLARYRDWVKRHAKGEPVAYLVGSKEFFSLKFEVHAGVLIPRPETEHVVIAAIDAAKTLGDRPVKIVDVGTGSGCIAVTLAKHIPNCTVLATDISADAIKVAKRNAEQHRVLSQVTFLNSDLFKTVPIDVRPDLIVSNPPYIGRQEIDSVDASVKDFEPEIALFAGDEGTEVIQRLVKEAADRLDNGGFLILETSPVIFARCLEIVTRENRFSEPQVIKDLAGHRRVIQVRKQT